MGSDSATPLGDEEASRLAAFRTVESLAALADLLDADDPHEAYFAAKREWRDLRGRELGDVQRVVDLPGTVVQVAGTPFWVHGVSHAGTDAERTFLRERIDRATADGGVVYCEQGIRPMYFDGLAAVCAMDDYRWALARRSELDGASSVGEPLGTATDALPADLDAASDRLREGVFSLVDAGRELYGDEFARALGDVATDFLTDHAGLAVGDEFASFQLTRAAADDPAQLPALQRYYECAFLPQPLEREWLRLHDPGLELVTHARNERMADYAVYHHDDAPRIHLVVGAAHQPGVRYYLEQHASGERELADFEPV